MYPYLPNLKLEESYVFLSRKQTLFLTNIIYTVSFRTHTKTCFVALEVSTTILTEGLFTVISYLDFHGFL